jgi:nickel-dependent lactate racemase
MPRTRKIDAAAFELPYGSGVVRLECRARSTESGDASSLPDRALWLAPNDIAAVPDPVAEVRRAVAGPIGTPRLIDLVRGRAGTPGSRIAIVVDDATRPVPTPILLKVLCEELRRAGVRDEQIAVVVATGLHRPLSEAERERLVGGLPLRVENHDPHEASGLVDLGATSLGTPLRVNRTVAEADLRILTGDVELHQFVGYGGGAKSVLPGIADAEGVLTTHAKMESPGAGPGRIDDNPIRLDIEEAADRLGIHFALNVVLDSRYDLVRALAGDVHQVLRHGAELVDRMFKVEVPEPVDVVLCSPGGWPRDVDLYQSQKAIRAARRITRRGGTIVCLAECREGHGSQLAYNWACEARSPQDIVDRHRRRFVMGGHKAYQLAVDVQWAEVYLHSALPREVTEAFFLKPLDDLGEIAAVLEKAESVAVLPQASATLPLVAGQDVVAF